MSTRRLLTAAAAVAALILPGVATAATIDDLRALGYTVGVASTHDDGKGGTCTVYSISGFGNSAYADTCDPSGQALIDSWANPVAFCNVRWQFDHPDQFQALQTLQGKGYSISGDQCADKYVVANRFTSAVVYSGSGAGLVSLAQVVAIAAPVTPIPGAPTTPTTPTDPGTCLPLCPTPAPAPVEPPPPPPPPPVAPAPAPAPVVPPATTTSPAPSTTDPAAAEAAAATVEASRFATVAESVSLTTTTAMPSGLESRWWA